MLGLGLILVSVLFLITKLEAWEQVWLFLTGPGSFASALLAGAAAVIAAIAAAIILRRTVV